MATKIILKFGSESYPASDTDYLELAEIDWENTREIHTSRITATVERYHKSTDTVYLRLE
jgi:hypothetical protein